MWVHEFGLLNVDFETQGDEFFHHLAQALPGRAGGAQTEHGVRARQVRIGSTPDPTVSTMLLVDQHPDGIVCTLRGDGEAPAPGEAAAWRAGIEQAVAQLGRAATDFLWEAIVGPDSYGRGPLDEPVQVGPIRLRPGGVCMRETVTSRLNLSGPFTPTYTYPLIAAGAVSSYNWTRGHLKAQRDVRRICALLTLTDPVRCWIPRSQPYWLEAGAPAVAVPTQGPFWHELGDPDRPGPWTGEQLEGAVPLTLPGWLPGSWEALAADPGLDRAVDAYYEAVRLEGEHPSAAHLAYVAAVEGFGERYAEPVPCDCCPDCRLEKGVAQVRFKEALREGGVSNKERRGLHQAYGLRSRTGHTGELLGAEGVFGFPEVNMFASPIEGLVTWQHLHRMRQATRQVLRTAIERHHAAG